MNWQLCLICQETSSEDLKCPLKVHGSGDKSAHISHFLTESNFLESSAVYHFLQGNIAVDDLVANRASWHKSCYGKFSNDKVERGQQWTLRLFIVKQKGLVLLKNCLIRMLVFSVKSTAAFFMNSDNGCRHQCQKHGD